MGAQYVQDHVDRLLPPACPGTWVDGVVSAPAPDPAETARIQQCISAWPNNTAEHFAATQQRLKSFADTGQLGIFNNGYWGHPEYRLPPEINLLRRPPTIWRPSPGSGISPRSTRSSADEPPPELRGGRHALRRQHRGQRHGGERPEPEPGRGDHRHRPAPSSIRSTSRTSWPSPASTRSGPPRDTLGNFLCFGDFPQYDVNDATTFFFPRGPSSSVIFPTCCRWI